MAKTTVTVPVDFPLPPEWNRVDPAAAGLPHADLVAMRTIEGAEFTPNVSVRVFSTPVDKSLEDLADEALGRLSSGVQFVELQQRRTEGESPDGCIVQIIELVAGTDVELADRRLVQGQALFENSVPGSASKVMVEMVLTCSHDQWPQIKDDYRTMLSRVEVDISPAQSSAGDEANGAQS